MRAAPDGEVEERPIELCRFEQLLNTRGTFEMVPDSENPMDYSRLMWSLLKYTESVFVLIRIMR